MALFMLPLCAFIDHAETILYLAGRIFYEYGEFEKSAMCLEHSPNYENTAALLELHTLRTQNWVNGAQYQKNLLWWYDADIAGKHVFVKHAGGSGDAVQFLRYVRHLHNAGATVTIEAPPALAELYALCPYIDKHVPVGTTIPDADMTITISTPAMTYAMRNELGASLDDVPYIYAKPNLCAYWKNVLDQLKGPKIGICWCSSPLRKKETGEYLTSPRSIPLELFAPLIAAVPATYISLQCGYGTNQLVDAPFTLTVFPNIDTTHGRFMDTLAIMKNLDLIITVDTSIAHIAGALGVPVWTILPACSDFRWFTERSDSPWYPTMRLFRQKPYEDWLPVLEQVQQELSRFFNVE